MNKQKLIDSYKGKNVYITGITGFKGSWLALMLHHLGANVHGIGKIVTDKRSIFHQAKINKIANVTIGDITDNANESKLIPSLTISNPDYVFHMAAQPIVSEGYEDPFSTFHTNIMGTVILHEVMRGLVIPANKDDLKSGLSYRGEGIDSSCKRVSFINVTTDKVYRELDRPLKEDDEMFGFDPYSLSKTCSDMISTCYRDALNSEHYISTMRAGNVIGGGDMSKNRIVPDIVKASLNLSEVTLRNPHSVRPYQHVFDALSAYLWIAARQREDKHIQDEYNIGPDISQTMETVELLDLMGENLRFKWNTKGETIGVESDYLALDNSKIKAAGWVPVYDTNEKVVDATSIWYNKFMNKENMQEFTLKQIEEAFNSYG